MTPTSTVVLEALDRLAPILAAAGVDPEASDEVRGLVTRAPDDVSVAVIGRQNAGKTTLIAVLTRNEQAREDITSDVQTPTSVAYDYTHNAAHFTVWDTPGLGSEHFGHDAEARDRVTKADAVIIAVSTDLVSEAGREQIVDLLKVGRKRGAVLAVVTKADREREENRPGIRETLMAAIPELGSEVHFVSAGEVLDAWLDEKPVPEGTGIPELSEALTTLALGEARRRQEATAAIRLLVLIDDVEEALASEEPEREVALRFQRRLRKLLTRTDRRLADALDTASRKERLAGFRVTATVGQALDEEATREQLDVAMAEAWDAFIDASSKQADELSRTIAQLLADAGAELERLQAGPLADSLKDYAASLSSQGFEAPGIDPIGGETAQKLLDAAQRAAKLLKGFKPLVKGKAVPLAPIIEIGLQGADWELERRHAEAVAAAKDSVRSKYTEQVDATIDAWDDHVDDVRDETTRSALAKSEAVEQDVFGQLTTVREQIETVAAARRAVDDFVTRSIASGYAEAA